MYIVKNKINSSTVGKKYTTFFFLRTYDKHKGPDNIYSSYYKCTINIDNHTKCIRDTHNEKASSNETPALSKSMNMNIWLAATSNKLFMRGS